MTLHSHSEYYAQFLDPETAPIPFRPGLLAIQALDMKSSFPFLLRLFDAWRTGDAAESDVQECLRIVESFLVRRIVCEVPTNSVHQMFREWARTLQRQHQPGSWLSTLLAAGTGSRRWPSNEEFTNQLLTAPLYTKRMRHMLVLLERSFDHKEQVDLSNCTIEHIMPQTLTAEWRAMLGPNAETTHRDLLHTLGNLTLTAYNPELSNSPFATKRELFANSHIELSRWPSEQAKWTESEISDRSLALAERALKIWPHPEG